MNVLLAEDNPVSQVITLGHLETLDCAITVVENGREAVDAVIGGTFDLVLMDCQMPEMSGIDAARAIRQASSDGKRVPIVAFTAVVRGDVDDVSRTASILKLAAPTLARPFYRNKAQLSNGSPRTGICPPIWMKGWRHCGPRIKPQNRDFSCSSKAHERASGQTRPAASCP